MARGEAAGLRAVLATLGAVDLVARAAGVLADGFRTHVAGTPWARVLCGLGLLLAGGAFPVLLACCEAFRQYGHSRVAESFQVLRVQYREAAAANKKDDALDEDEDGVPDVFQVSEQALISRKALLFMRVVNPQQVSDAALSLWLVPYYDSMSISMVHVPAAPAPTPRPLLPRHRVWPETVAPNHGLIR